MLINCSTVVNNILLRLTVYWAGTELSIDGDGKKPVWEPMGMDNRVYGSGWGWM